jgi:2-desacetyl-2-hydroxyethyl bacteriochlorophyllide A dehydrogenase
MKSNAAKRLAFPAKQSVVLEPYELTALAETEVRVKTQVSLMSTGTENIVFNRLFGPGTHWDRWVKYPFHPGYAAVGTVEEVGSAVKDLSPGQLVVARKGHVSAFNAPANDCVAVPDGVEPQQAAWFALAKIAAMGARKAQYGFTDSVLVIGAGPIGQMSLRWALAAGVEKAAMLDPLESRLALATRAGAHAVISQSVDQAKDTVLSTFGGSLPNIVVDSTGHPAVFTAALGLVRNQGKLVLIGDTGNPEEQRLTPDVVTRGLTIVGAHDGHTDADFNSNRIYRMFFQLVKGRRFDVSGLNTHTFRPEDCSEAYRVANAERGKTMGILFDWSAQ